MNNTRTEIRPLSEEFAGADLGNTLRVKRLGILLDSAVRAPAAGLPAQAGNPGSLEGTYRFLNNEHIEPESVLAVHMERAAERAAEYRDVVVVHDTTQFEFGGEAEREGLGPMRGKGQGFFSHVALGFAPTGQPLGILGMRAWARSEIRKGKRSAAQAQEDPDRESLRWFEVVEDVAERLDSRVEAVHVMDREGDNYELFAQLREAGQRFVIRLAHDRSLSPNRRVKSGPPKLFAAMGAGDIKLEREVGLSRRTPKRSPKAQKIHPPRAAREAQLLVRASKLVVPRGQHAPVHLPSELELHFVDVEEPNPPENQPAVSWRLVTTEPVNTPEQVARVVDVYRQRWQIEEYFKALKTGCAFEKLQLESARSLSMALVIFGAVAWHLMLLRWMERNEGDRPAGEVLTLTQLRVLGAVRRKAGKPLRDNPTCRDVLLAIAGLGGHLPNNGPPGWQVLGRGLIKLLALEEGWLAAAFEYDENPDR